MLLVAVRDEIARFGAAERIADGAKVRVGFVVQRRVSEERASRGECVVNDHFGGHRLEHGLTFLAVMRSRLCRCGGGRECRVLFADARRVIVRNPWRMCERLSGPRWFDSLLLDSRLDLLLLDSCLSVCEALRWIGR